MFLARLRGFSPTDDLSNESVVMQRPEINARNWKRWIVLIFVCAVIGAGVGMLGITVIPRITSIVRLIQGSRKADLAFASVRRGDSQAAVDLVMIRLGLQPLLLERDDWTMKTKIAMHENEMRNVLVVRYRVPDTMSCIDVIFDEHSLMAQEIIPEYRR